MKRFVYLILAGFGLLNVHAQDATLHGIVTDATDGETLIGASVQHAADKGMVTDVDGSYLFTLPPGEYEYDGMMLLVTKDVVKFPAENVLAGAASPISLCVGNMMEFTGCSLADAIKMASTNPARLMGLTDLGEISEGKRADLILFTLEDGEMIIQQTMVAGEVVYSKE